MSTAATDSAARAGLLGACALSGLGVWVLGFRVWLALHYY